jgi:pimeloyl-ACP methyl ester carboxylesterase
MKLNYTYKKNGKPVLVMVHGLLSSLETFSTVTEPLESHFDLLLIDQRGHGKSPPLGSDYSAMTMARDINELLIELQIDKVHFLGHSMGARTAMAFLEIYPEKLLSLIIEDMGIHIRQEQSIEKDIEKNRIAKEVEVDSLIFKSREDIFSLISPLYSYADDLMKTKVVETINNQYELKFWPHVSVLYGYQGNTTDFTHVLAKTSVPILILIADQKIGSALSNHCIEHIKKHVPNAKLVTIENAWHTIHKTHPVEFSNALLTFLVKTN